MTWMDLLKDIISSLVPWPVIVFLLLVYLAWVKSAPRRLAEIFKPFRSVKLFGAEFVLSEEEAREVAKDADEAFEGYRKQAQRDYDRLIEVYGLKQKLEAVVQSHVRPILGRIHGNKRPIPDFRCTAHVPYILFTDTLYQLLDYYPRGGSRGRIRSARFGIIGRTWRLGESQTQGRVPVDPRELIRGWGMTREEADAAGLGRKSFSCVVLQDEEGTPAGVFYMDSKSEDAFGADDDKPTRDELHGAIVDGCNRCGLTNAVAKLSRELRRRSPLIRIYQ